MAIVTRGKGGPRQIILIVILVIIAIGVGVYLYSTQKPAPSPGPETLVNKAPKVKTPTETSKTAVPKTKTPEVKQKIKILKTTFNTEVLKKLEKLDLVLYGKLPIKVDPEEVGRTNPFVGPD
jgi:flagellar basal body-associated protein FliL